MNAMSDGKMGRMGIEWETYGGRWNLAWRADVAVDELKDGLPVCSVHGERSVVVYDGEQGRKRNL